MTAHDNYTELAREINNLKTDLGTGLAALQIVLQRNGSDAEADRAHVKEIQLRMHDQAIKIAKLETRLHALEPGREDTQQHSTELELLKKRIGDLERSSTRDLLKLETAKEKRTTQELQALTDSKRARFGFYGGIITAVLSAVVALSSVLLPLLFH